MKLTKLIAFDTETTGLDVPNIDRPFMVGLCNEDLDGWYCEWPVDPFTRKITPAPKDVKYLRSVLTTKQRNKVAFNTVFDIMGCESIGVDVPKPYEDSMIACKRARTNEYNYKLKQLGEKYLEIPKDDEDELHAATVTARAIARKYKWNCGEEVEQDYWMPAAIKRLLPHEFYRLPANADKLCGKYCILDCKRAMLLHLLIERVSGKKERAGYLREMELMPIVIEMQKVGWRVYPERLALAKQGLLQDVARIKAEINRWANPPLEKFTNETYRSLLYDELEQGQYCDPKDVSRSVDKAHLQIMQHPVADLILDLKDANDCITKFLDPIGGYSTQVGKQHIVYPKFNQVGARTFRFSATRPPIQTIPDAAKTKSNMSVRQCIGPRDGERWYLFDYKSLQVRIFADRAKEPNMLAAIKRGEDPHGRAAQLAWGGEDNKPGVLIVAGTLALSEYAQQVKEWCHKHGISTLFERQDFQQIAEALLEENNFDIIKAEHEIGSEKARSIAKTLLFLLLFGGGPKKAAKGLRCTVQEASAFLNQYKDAMPRIKIWMREIIRFARKHGYVLTAYDDVLHVDPTFEYRGVNYDVQGSEAAFVKDRMRAANKLLVAKRMPFKLFGQVHDELGFCVHCSEDDPKALKEIKLCLEDNTGHFGLETPCSVDRVETYWNEREKVEIK